MKSPLGATQNGNVKRLEDDVRQGFVFETVSTRILSVALELVTPRRRSLSWNWVCLREPRAPTVKLACAHPRTTVKGAEMVDEVDNDVHSISHLLLEFLDEVDNDVHSISHLLLEFLSLRPVSLP